MLLGCYWYMYPWQRALDFVRYFDLSLRGIFQRMLLRLIKHIHLQFVGIARILPYSMRIWEFMR